MGLIKMSHLGVSIPSFLPHTSTTCLCVFALTALHCKRNFSDQLVSVTDQAGSQKCISERKSLESKLKKWRIKDKQKTFTLWREAKLCRSPYYRNTTDR